MAPHYSDIVETTSPLLEDQYPIKVHEQRPVPIRRECIVKVPVTKVIRTPVIKTVNVPVERIVEKVVLKKNKKFIEVPVDRIIEKPIERIIEVRREVVVEKPINHYIEKIVEVPYEVLTEKLVEVPVEKTINIIVEKVVEKIVEVPVERVIERVVEVTVERCIQKEVEVVVESVVQYNFEIPVLNTVSRPQGNLQDIVKTVERFEQAPPIIVEVDKEYYIDAVDDEMVRPAAKKKGAPQKPTLGIEIKMLDDGEGGKDNVMVAHSVKPGGPSDKAGIILNDVLARWEDIPLTSKSVFVNQLNDSKPGQVVTLEIVRDNNNRLTIPVQIGATNKKLGGKRTVKSGTKLKKSKKAPAKAKAKKK